jgi:hypothetical protein
LLAIGDEEGYSTTIVNTKIDQTRSLHERNVLLMRERPESREETGHEEDPRDRRAGDRKSGGRSEKFGTHHAGPINSPESIMGAPDNSTKSAGYNSTSMRFL